MRYPKKSKYKKRPYNKYRVYNTDNLKPFNSDSGSYYGKIGGYNSGKSRLKAKIERTLWTIQYDKLDLEPYLYRKRIYNREYREIKDTLHRIKINTNRLNKLINKYNIKYDIKA